MKPTSHWLRSLSLTVAFAVLAICLPLMSRQALTAYAGDEDFTISDGVLTKYTGTDADVVIPDSVTSIGSNAFYGKKTVKSVTIPSSVTYVGEGAFRSCTALVTVSMSDMVTDMGNSVFYDCSALTDVRLSERLVTMGSQTFRNCSKLVTVSLPDTLASMGSESFVNCAKLQTVNIGKALRSTLSYQMFSECPELQSINVAAANPIYSSNDGVLLNKTGNKLIYYPHGRMDYTYAIPETVKVIDSYAFEGVSYLTEMTIPSPVTTVGTHAFANCASLAEVTIGDSVKTIGEAAFYRNAKLETLTLGENLETIGDDAFFECRLLGSVSLPDSLYELGNSAFSGCSTLRRVRMSGALESMGDYAFNATAITTVTLPPTMTSINPGTFKDCQKLTTVTLPETIVSIGREAFRNDVLLISINLPDGLIEIGNNAFDSCTALKSVTMPDTVETIGTGVFNACTALQSAHLSAALESIPHYTFSGCSKLARIDLPTAPVSIGSSAFENCVVLPSIVIPDTVVSIDSYAFQNCKKLASVTLPQNLTAIPYRCFAGCVALDSIEVPAKVTVINAEAFDGCAALTAVTLVDGLKTVRYNAFRSCAALVEITFPNTVTTLESAILSGCIELKACTFPTGITAIPNSFFEGDVKLTSFAVPSKVTAIRYNAFKDCVTLAELTLPEKLETIESRAFQNCQELTTVALPTTLVTIGDSAFQDCSTLADIHLPDSLTTIGSSAFANCPALTSMVLPEGLTKLSYALFDGCTYLENVTLSDQTISIGDYAFRNCQGLRSIYIPSYVATVGSNAFQGCTRLTEIALPDSVTDIGNAVFTGCTGLKTAKLPARIKTVTDSMFRSCYNMTAVTLPDELVTISNNAFRECESLRSVTFPETLQSIGSSAFEECKSLRSVVLPASVTDIYSWAFHDCTTLSVISIPETVTRMDYRCFFNNATITNVYYGGSEEAWTNLITGHDLFNTTLTMHYGTTFAGPTLTSIVISRFPDTTSYGVGEEFDPTGIELMGINDDLSTVAITEDIVCTTEPFTHPGLQQVEVTYGGKRTCFTVYVHGTISVTVQPVNTTVMAGEEFSFPLVATGTADELSYQWFYKKDGAKYWTRWAGKTDATLTAVADDTMDNMKVFCKISDNEGQVVNSHSAYLTLTEAGDPYPNGPVITTQPKDAMGEVNSKVTFTVAAEGTDLTYQWYYKKANDADFTAWSGRTSDSATATVYNSWNHSKYYCVITDASGRTVQTDIVELTVGVPGPVITTQPVSAQGEVNDKVVFSVEATGDGLTYQWYYKKTTDNDFVRWNGKTAASVTATVYNSWNHAQYYCVVTDASGVSVQTDTVELTVGTAQPVGPVITTQPQNAEGALNSTVTFSVEATGDGLTYQWYYKKTNEAEFTKWNGKTASSVTATVYNSWNNCQYYCVVTDANGRTAQTDTVKMTVAAAQPQTLAITTHPKDASGSVNTKVTFTVAATGDGVTYQWYYKKPDATSWTAWKNGTAASLSAPVYNSWNGTKFYCKLTDKNGNTLNSGSAKMMVATKITQQPQNAEGAVNSTVTFSVQATGLNLSYQWYYKKANESDFTKWSGKTSASVNATVYNSWNNCQYYCVITDANGKTVQTDTVKLTVK